MKRHESPCLPRARNTDGVSFFQKQTGSVSVPSQQNLRRGRQKHRTGRRMRRYGVRSTSTVVVVGMSIFTSRNCYQSYYNVNSSRQSLPEITCLFTIDFTRACAEHPCPKQEACTSCVGDWLIYVENNFFGAYARVYEKENGHA